MRIRLSSFYLLIFFAAAFSIILSWSHAFSRGNDVHAEFEVSTQAELDAALAQVQDGQTILLTDGSFGALSIKNRNNVSGITIAAKAGSAPHFTVVKIDNSSHWTISGVHVRPRVDDGTAEGREAVLLNGSYLTFENSTVNFADDISNWSAEDWISKAGNAIRVNGSYQTIRNNEITNVAHAITSGADHIMISGNTIVNIRGDGIRTLGDDVVIEYNLIKNCYDVDDNHDDGIQSWSIGDNGVGSGVVRNVTIRGNTIINNEDPNQPLKGPMQGIGLFDGFFENWTIENNLIVVDHWHGISMYGARDSRIINNTVLDINDTEPGPPWIRVVPHKNGTPSENVIVRNNLTTKLTLQEGGVTNENNIIITDLNAHFIDANARDYRLIASSSAIDAGSSTDAPMVDLGGIRRPQGAGIDVGAFEFVADGGQPPTSPEPTTETPEPTSTPSQNETATPTATAAPLPVGGTLSGQLFADIDQDGVRDPAEAVMEGIVVLLIDAATNGEMLTVTATTDEDGRYQFTNVPPTEYIIRFDLPDGYMPRGATGQRIITNGGTVVLPNQGIIQVEELIFLPLIEK